MKVVIAEKPSVAREIAMLLGATKKKEGYQAGNGYAVTWALGHLVGLGMPEDYGISGFAKEALPILPQPFLLTARKAGKGKDRAADPAAWRQLQVIDRLFKACDGIIVATDAGREGELIFRYIYEYLNCQKPFERLWVSSLTEKAIRYGLENLKPGSDFDGLYHAALCRSRADWLVGINASQALTLAAGRGVYSLGRVQTPTLMFVCKRYLEHKSFVAQKYWQIELEHRKEFIDFRSISELKWEDKSQAENAVKSILRKGMAVVTSLERKSVTEQPPLLFDLTGLQKEANRKLGLTAEETLTIAQGLYEKKFITYPRTGSKFLPEDMWPDMPVLVSALGNTEEFKAASSKVKWGRLNKRIVNDLKVTDHHGLLTTEKIPSALPAKDKAVYDMIAYRLLEAVSYACSKEITEVNLEVLHYRFGLRGCKITEPGWRAIRGNFSDDESELIMELPDLKEGTELRLGGAATLERKTKAPALYTEATLLGAMETAGREIENDGERKALQGLGIGTSATRAAIIEALLDREYIQRAKKSLLPTEKGLQVFQLVHDKKIADVAMTAEWELALLEIENSNAGATEFQKKIEAYTVSITKELLDAVIQAEKLPELTCPKCKSGQLTIRDKIMKCPDDSCNWHIFRNICGVQLSLADLQSLVNAGRTGLIKGMRSKKGVRFDAYIELNDKAETVFAFEDKDKAKRK